MIAALLAPGHSPSAMQTLASWVARHDQDRQPVRGGSALLSAFRAQCSRSGATVLDGWIDSIEQLQSRLGVAETCPATLYELALEAFPDSVDDEIVGEYAAITKKGDGTLRLARSPLAAPPLNYGIHDGVIAAASLPTALLALGWPAELDWEALVDLLAIDPAPENDGSPYRSINRVQLGSVVILRPDGARVDRWYARKRFASAPAADEATYLKRVEELLGEACRNALRHTKQPSIQLSGGLDSPLVASELMRHMPEDATLHGVTFVPASGWDRRDLPGSIADEWPAVQRFAEMHPRLAIHRAKTEQGDFDYRFRDISALAGVCNPGLANFGSFHSVWQTARDLGSDWMFSAGLGNQTISSDGRWAYAELFRSFRWGSMLKALRGRPNDPRPIWRKLLALAAMPHLPRAWRATIKRWIRPSRADMLAWTTFLSPKARRVYRGRARQRGSAPIWEGFAMPASRSEMIRQDLLEHDNEFAEIQLVLEMKYGVRYRDITAYRPLAEYCFSLPTHMFLRDGQHRYLARELARGRMPEEQRTSRIYGRHGADWHARMKPRLSELTEQIEAMQSHPVLSEILDLEGMKEALAHFPESVSEDEFENMPWCLGLPRALLAGQFVGLAERRNDF